MSGGFKVEVPALSKTDRDYLLRKLSEPSALSAIANKKRNHRAREALKCVLSNQPLVRQGSGQIKRGQWRTSDGNNHPITVMKVTQEEMDELWEKSQSSSKRLTVAPLKSTKTS